MASAGPARGDASPWAGHQGAAPPWDMLYCQNMLTMTMCQLQQWEQYRYQLALHLQGALQASAPPSTEQLMQHFSLPAGAATAVQSMLQDPSVVHVQVSREAEVPAVPAEGLRRRVHAPRGGAARAAQPQPAAPAPRQPPAPDGAADAAAGAQADADWNLWGAPPAEGEEERLENEAGAGFRFPFGGAGVEMVVILKGAVFLFICEVTPTILCLYATLACLYLAGAFNFAKRWVQGWARRPELEVHLVRLREQQLGEAPEVPAAGGDDAAAAPEADPPPFWARYIYQLVVMYVMSMLPWWTPDERYLV